jgi:hypothetical protein
MDFINNYFNFNLDYDIDFIEKDTKKKPTLNFIKKKNYFN